MAKKQEVRDYKAMDKVALNDELKKKQIQLVSARIEKKTGSVTDTSKFKKLRRAIAVINTFINQK